MGNQFVSAWQLLFCFLGETRSLYSLFPCQTLASYILFVLVPHIFDCFRIVYISGRCVFTVCVWLHVFLVRFQWGRQIRLNSLPNTGALNSPWILMAKSEAPFENVCYHWKCGLACRQLVNALCLFSVVLCGHALHHAYSRMLCVFCSSWFQRCCVLSSGRELNFLPNACVCQLWQHPDGKEEAAATEMYLSNLSCIFGLFLSSFCCCFWMFTIALFLKPAANFVIWLLLV